MDELRHVLVEAIESSDELSESLSVSGDAWQWLEGRKCGSGTFADAYLIDWFGERAVLKITRDDDDCERAERALEEGPNIRGILNVYAFWPIDVEGMQLYYRPPRCVQVVERVAVADDAKGWKHVALGAISSYLDATGYPSQTRMMEDADFWELLIDPLKEQQQREAAERWLADLQAGLEWMGDVDMPDPFESNFGLVRRTDREQAVWLDLGQ